MAIKRGRKPHDQAPSVQIRPAAVEHGNVVAVAGSGWPLDTITIAVGNEERSPGRILTGSRFDDQLVPASDGSFLFELPTEPLSPGRFVVRAKSRAGVRAEAKLRIEKRNQFGPKVPRSELDKPAMRGNAFKNDRTRDGRWPQGFSLAMRRDWLEKFGFRGRQETPGGQILFSAPIPGACNWVPLGPAPFTNGKGSVHGSNTGRIRSIAIDSLTPSRMFVGTASGGVFKSGDGGLTWAPKTDDKFSLAIGALAVDPVAPNNVYAGTGEMVPGTDYGHYYGRGLLRSNDFGETWAEIGMTDFDLAEIARIVIDPSDPANLFVAASNGVWESMTSGSSWTQLSPDPCTDVVLVRNPAEPGTRRIIAGFAYGNIRRSVDTGGGWGSFSDIAVPGAPASSRRIVFGVCRTQPNTMYAAFSEAGSGGNLLAHVSRSDDWGQTWNPRTIPSTGRLYASYYNLAIQPHPADPDTVLLNVVDVFKSIDGGGSWNVVGMAAGLYVHVDAHAIAWHPTNPNSVFVASDGGLFFTADLGGTWQARNLDIAAIQLYDLGQHPTYEAIMIAGSQDNGGFHYSGAPIWRRTWVAPGVVHNDMGGDVVFSQIDPFDGYVHYYGTGPEASNRRSDNAGRLFTVSWASFNGTQWWTPFYPDPRTTGVLFTGGARLWRSPDRGSSWDDITADLAAPIRSMAFHPTDAGMQYLGTTGGHVYRVTGPAAGAWTPATVTTEEVTYTGLPPGIGISSMAVDASGNLWATSSDLMHTEGTGEFTNNHVFRLDTGAMSWAARSDGLVVANPINTIVVDPADATGVFCGGDRGVFAWNASLERWDAMDKGLPNAPVVKLAIHMPSRKLRAASFGRGVWERTLDGVGCPDHFLYLRDNLVDSGATPSPDGVPHPYVAGERCWHWQSEDIVCDSNLQTPTIVTSPSELYDKVVHLGARRGPNRVYVTLHNKGPFAVTDVQVRAFFAEAAAGLPAFPPGLLADPFTWNPAGPSAWIPIAPAGFGIPRVEPGTTRLAHWELTIPMSAHRHSCLLAFVTSAEDPFGTAGITDPDELVVHNRKVALRNLDLEPMPGSGSGGSSDSGGGSLPAGWTTPREVKLHSRHVHGTLTTATILCGNVPQDAVILVAVDKRSRRKFRVDQKTLSANAKKARDELALHCKDAPEAAHYDLKGLIALDSRPGQEIVVGELPLRKDGPASLLVWVRSDEWDHEATYTLDVVQWTGSKVTGGYTIQIVDFARLLREGSTVVPGP